MRSAAIVGFGAISSLGRGEAAFHTGGVGDAARIATAVDAELSEAGLTRPFCARVGGLDDESDRAAQLLRVALEDALADLDRAIPGARGRRVGLALATSSGGMRGAEKVFRALHEGRPVTPEEARAATYFAPVEAVLADLHLAASPSTLVLTACAASTIALGLGLGWLERGACDVVLAGGFDAVSVFVASGFEVLRATTTQLPSRPFRAGRDGMALGEGAAVMALVRPEDAPSRAFGYVAGFGATGDAVHVTAPDRTGDGLGRAALAALSGAAPEEVGLVSAHATATPFNDAAEWKAMIRALGERARDVAVHPFKAQIGHTLGAAGALESLAALGALRRGVLPAAAVSGEPDPEAPARLLARAEPTSARTVLKLSAAFGGANASLLLRLDPPHAAPPAARPAYVSAPAVIAGPVGLERLAAVTGQRADRLARADDLSHLALAAVGALGAALGAEAIAGAGIVVGHAYATLDVNEQYERRILERGARLAEPRRFPYTSPNGVAGECSVAFGLTGPNLAVGGGLHGGLEALVVACDLVRAGDAERVVAVAVDAPGVAARAVASALGWPVPRSGAVAVLVTSSPAGGAEVLAAEVAVGGAPATGVRPGHEALLPLQEGATSLESVSPSGSRARVVLRARS